MDYEIADWAMVAIVDDSHCRVERPKMAELGPMRPLRRLTEWATQKVQS